MTLTLPGVKSSTYFYQAEDHTAGSGEERKEQQITYPGSTTPSTIDILPKGQKPDEQTAEFSWTKAKKLLWSHFTTGYSNPTVLQWNFFWALNTSGFRMWFMCAQPLWHFIEPERENIYNGFTEAGLFVGGAIGALLAAKVNQQFVEKAATWIMASSFLAMGCLLMLSGNTSSVIVAYAAHIVNGTLYFSMVVICR